MGGQDAAVRALFYWPSQGPAHTRLTPPWDLIKARIRAVELPLAKEGVMLRPVKPGSDCLLRAIMRGGSLFVGGAPDSPLSSDGEEGSSKTAVSPKSGLDFSGFEEDGFRSPGAFGSSSAGTDFDDADTLNAIREFRSVLVAWMKDHETKAGLHAMVAFEQHGIMGGIDWSAYLRLMGHVDKLGGGLYLDHLMLLAATAVLQCPIVIHCVVRSPGGHNSSGSGSRVLSLNIPVPARRMQTTYIHGSGGAGGQAPSQITLSSAADCIHVVHLFERHFAAAEYCFPAVSGHT